MEAAVLGLGHEKVGSKYQLPGRHSLDFLTPPLAADAKCLLLTGCSEQCVLHINTRRRDRNAQRAEAEDFIKKTKSCLIVLLRMRFIAIYFTPNTDSVVPHSCACCDVACFPPELGPVNLL